MTPEEMRQLAEDLSTLAQKKNSGSTKADLMASMIRCQLAAEICERLDVLIEQGKERLFDRTGNPTQGDT